MYLRTFLCFDNFRQKLENSFSQARDCAVGKENRLKQRGKLRTIFNNRTESADRGAHNMAQPNSRHSTAASKSLGKLRFRRLFACLARRELVRSKQIKVSAARLRLDRRRFLARRRRLNSLFRLAAEPVEREFISPERCSSNSLSRSPGRLYVDQLPRESFCIPLYAVRNFSSCSAIRRPSTLVTCRFRIMRDTREQLARRRLPLITIF